MKKQTELSQSGLSRRQFMRRTAGTLAATVFPAIVPSTVFGANAPSNRLQVGCIGVGRKGLGDLGHVLKPKDKTRVIAVCDLDSKRAAYAQDRINRFYEDRQCATIHDYRELVVRKDVDAVVISTPDHWHALPAIAAAKAGKAVFIQKPLSLTIAEGRAIADAAAQNKTVFQVGSQQRSNIRFQVACRLAREGKLGALKTIEVGLGTDPGCGVEAAMPVPKNLDYEFWLGQAPSADYTEKRVHPQEGYDRPGWLRIRDYGAGMITGWGAHHLDIAHWGMGLEQSGPIEVEGWAKFPESGLWNVHGDFDLTYRYANGVTMRVADTSRLKQGVRFIGSEGSIYVDRGALEATPAALLAKENLAGNKGLSDDDDQAHMDNFVDAARGKATACTSAEIAHRSCTACLLGAIVMELGRKVQWDPEKEQFANDPEATAKLTRAMRAPWKL